MNWSGKMWACTDNGQILNDYRWDPPADHPWLFKTRAEARYVKSKRPYLQVVRVQVDVKVIE